MILYLWYLVGIIFLTGFILKFYINRKKASSVPSSSHNGNSDYDDKIQ